MMSKFLACCEFQTSNFNRYVPDSDDEAPPAQELLVIRQAPVAIQYTLTNETRHNFLDSIQHGRLRLVNTILSLHDLPHTPWLDRRHKYKHITSMHMTELLCSISTALIVKLIMGSLPWASRTDEPTSSELAAIANMKNPTPGIYIMYLVDEHGLGPSWREWAPVLDAAEKYASIGDEADDIASRVDNVHHTRKTNIPDTNRRKYLLSDSDRKKPEMTWTTKDEASCWDSSGVFEIEYKRRLARTWTLVTGDRSLKLVTGSIPMVE